MKTPFITPALLACSIVLLSACSSSDDDTDTSTLDEGSGLGEETGSGTGSGSGLIASGTTQYAYTFTRSDDFESGQIERISITDGFIVDGTYPGTTSDHTLATDDEAVYQIGRFDIDNLTRFSASDTSVVDYQLSLIRDEQNTTNPQSLVFFDEDLAYLTRRSSDSLLVLDPTPDPITTDSLITGEISLAAYNRTVENEDGAQVIDLPDMTDAIIVDDMLFVLLENLDGFLPVNPAFVAVFSTITDTEIDTESSAQFPLLGIQLQTVNPTGLQFNETTGEIYVVGRGNFFNSPDVPGDAYTGGIESINPETFQTNLLVDDGTADDNNGFFTDAVIIDNMLGYVITLDGFAEDFSSINSLRTFNPSTGEVSDPIDGIEQQSLTTLAVGPDNHLWVGVLDAVPGFVRIDLETGIPAQEQVVTSFIPTNVIFIDVETGEAANEGIDN